MTAKPNFIKYFLPRSSSSQLLIPSTFMHCIGGYLPKKIFLHDRHYNLWQIKTRKVGEKWYFKKGWQKFVEDNNILPRDSLVFDYCEEDLFIVKILGPNGCQTEGARTLVSMDFDSETDEDGDGTEEMDDELKRRGNLYEDQNGDEIYFSEDSEDEDDYIEDADYSPNNKIKVRQALSEESEDDDEGTEDVDHSSKKKIKVERDEEGEDGDDEAERDEEGKDGDDEAEDLHASLSDKRIQVEHDFLEETNGDDDDDEEEEEDIEGSDYLCEKREDDDNGIEVNVDYLHDEEAAQVEQVQNVAVSKAKRKRETTPPPLYPRYCGMEIFEKGMAAIPSNPYFVTKIKPTRTFDLFIPLPLIEDYQLDLPKPTMLLVDPEGREFQGKFKMWKDGRIVYSGQWKSLLRRNDIEIGDTCICEFLNGVQGLYLKVSFLRTRNDPN